MGTGFFFGFFDENNKTSVPLIVTNHHVVEDSTSATLTFTKTNAAGLPDVGRMCEVTIPHFDQVWKRHPDTNVDLAAIPISSLLSQQKSKGNSLYCPMASPQLIPTQKELEALDAVEEVIMVGYPIGLWDSHNNMPIFRRGITATRPALDYLGKRMFLIDAACFPGSSGSPVYYYNKGMKFKGDSHIKISGGVEPRLYLLGILYAGPQHTVEGELVVVTVPTSQAALAISSIPTHLGYVIRSDRLLDFKTLFIQ